MTVLVCPHCGRNLFRHCKSPSCPWRMCGNPKCDVEQLPATECKNQEEA